MDRSSRRAWVVRLLTAAVFAAGCALSNDVPVVRVGTPCAACGMSIQNKRFACVRVQAKTQKQYDSIECLVRDGPAAQGETVYLADYDHAELHPADSLWVVKGDMASPMGGGLAAFQSQTSAEDVMAATHGMMIEGGKFIGEARK